MLTPGDTVVAGVSGGADSLCLLFLLKELQKEMSLTLAVVHVNHMLRPEACEEAAYVERLCKELQVPFYLKEVAVEQLAKEQGISTEEAGRNVRYEAFSEVLGELTSDPSGKIAVAHHANDRAETMLFHLFRGTGLTGLSGIKPVRGQIIRPLLCLGREEIEHYLQDKKIAYCIDSSNNEDTYTRNKIRHNILPYASQHICERAVEHMNHTAEMLLETESYLQEQTNAAFTRVAKEVKEGISLSVELFLREPVLLQKRLLLLCMEKLAPGRKDITAVHVQDMLSLFVKEGNKRLNLPYGIIARREFDRVLVGTTVGCHKTADRGQETGNRQPIISFPVTIPGTVEIDGVGVFEFAVFSYDSSKNIPQKTYTKWFDYDKIEKCLTLRKRAVGDFLTIDEKSSKKTLKKYFIEQKIPKDKRDEMYVLTQENHVLWVPGYRISHDFKVSADTKTILQVYFRGGK